MMTHTSPNITQLTKDPEIRKTICVPKGKIFVDVDADALELVMMGHYLGPYDNYKYAIAVDSGDKSKGTDIHTLNQKAAGIPTRDLAKTFIYSMAYGAGETKIGDSIWDRTPFKYSEQDYNEAKEKVLKRASKIDDQMYFPLSKDTFIPLTEDVILASIYGKQTITKFLDNTLGYRQLVQDTTNSVKNNKLIGLDGRELFVRSNHKAFNLLLQSAGAIFMKYYLVVVENELSKLFTHGKEYAYIANIHDAINLEIIPEIKTEVALILRESFTTASNMLGLKYKVKGEPAFGLNQSETH